MHRIGWEVKRIRIRREWTVRNLAILSGVTEPTIRGIERGKNTSVNTLNKIAKALGTTTIKLAS